MDIRQRLSAALAGRYRLLHEIGRGGAAVVYLAEDLKHERRVALKVLRGELAATLGASRFLREIKILARLSHPHILPVHDSGEADGFLYFVMPYVEGESLRARIARGPMPISEAVPLLRNLLDALHYAHERGVVHRDIKPDNVMLSGRHALVMDFGVAKALTAAAEERQGDTLGTVLGTPAYMAPEQASADPSIDHRADIYALGVVAYEMLSGAPPFQGRTSRQILAAHVTKNPEHLSQHRENVPPALAEVVMRCLEKNPSDRWQTAEETLHRLDQGLAWGAAAGSGATTEVTTPVAAASRHRGAALIGTLAVVAALVAGWFLRGPTAATVAGTPTVVVLPFENLGPPEDEFFANGITDAITARLATLDNLGVISRTSAMQYRNRDLTAQEIANELGVDYILEGTIQRERPSDPNSRVRIIPQLIRAADDTHLWADVYDEDLTEVFRVQSEIAQRVARAMDVTLQEPDQRILAARPTDNLEAYEFYLRGHDYLAGNLGSGDANARRIAVDFFERALALDGVFALAWAELSLAHIWLYHHFVDPTEERLALAKAAVDTAMILDPALPAVHLAEGHYYYWGPNPDPVAALREFQHVADREPNNAYARSLIAALQASRGDWDEALRNAALAADLAPREPEWTAAAGGMHLMARRYEEAERYIDRALALAPDYAEAWVDKITLYLRWTGDIGRAREAVNEMLRRVIPGQVAQALVTAGPELIVGGEYDSLFESLTPGSVAGPLPFDYYHIKAEFHRLRNRSGRARVYYDSLRAVAQVAAAERPANPVAQMFLGLAYAGLDRKLNAVRHAGQLEGLLAQSRDALRNAVMRNALVSIYAIVGEDDAAMDHLEQLLSGPSLMSVPYLKVAQFPGTLRDHPRFKRLTEEEALPGVAMLAPRASR